MALESTVDENIQCSSENEMATTGNEMHAIDSAQADKVDLKVVKCTKVAVLVVLLLGALGVALPTHYYLKNTQKLIFQDKFKDDAAVILGAVGMSVENTFAMLDSVAVSLESYAVATNQVWPFVTIPHFATRILSILPITDAINVNVVPLVSAPLREEWEAYSIANDKWVNEAVQVQDNWDGYSGPIVYNGTQNGAIHGSNGDIPNNIVRDFFLPGWQNFPVIPNSTWTYNFDWNSVSFSNVYTTPITTAQSVISQPYLIPMPDVATQNETEAFKDRFSAYVSPSVDPLEPTSDFVYPIFDSIGPNRTTGKVVGELVSNVYWRDVIQNVLPTGTNGILVVFSNPCTESFSYALDGPQTQYLGVGDNHDTNYDTLGLHANVYDLYSHNDNSISSMHASLDVELCPVTVHIYPSAVMESEFTTKDPVLFPLIVVVIFAMTALVFCVYVRSVDSVLKGLS